MPEDAPLIPNELALKERQVLALERIAKALDKIVAEPRVKRTRTPRPVRGMLSETLEIAELFKTWSDNFGAKPVTVREALHFAATVRDHEPKLWALLCHVGISRRKIECTLARFVGKELGGLVLERCDPRDGDPTWSVKVGSEVLRAMARARGILPPCSASCADGECATHGAERAQFRER